MANKVIFLEKTRMNALNMYKRTNAGQRLIVEDLNAIVLEPRACFTPETSQLIIRMDKKGGKLL